MKRSMIIKNIVIAVLICAGVLFSLYAAMILSDRQGLFGTGKILLFAVCLTAVYYGCVWVDMICLLAIFPRMHKGKEPVPGSLLSSADKIAAAVWYGRKKNLYSDMIVSKTDDTRKSRKIRNFGCEVAYLFISASLGALLLIDLFIVLVAIPSVQVFRLLFCCMFTASSLLAITVQRCVEKGCLIYTAEHSDPGKGVSSGGAK